MKHRVLGMIDPPPERVETLPRALQVTLAGQPGVSGIEYVLVSKASGSTTMEDWRSPPNRAARRRAKALSRKGR